MNAQPTQQEREKAREIRARMKSRGGNYVANGHLESDIAQALADAREAALREAAEVVDQCNREGPYNAIGAASRIRALIGDSNG